MYRITMSEHYTRATTEVMVRSVGRYLNGESEHEILLGCFYNGFLISPRIRGWAETPDVNQQVCLENGWEYPEYGMRLERREREAPKRREWETQARAVIEYIIRPDVTQADIFMKYKVSSARGGLRVWYDEPRVRRIVCKSMGYEDDSQLDRSWEEKKSVAHRRLERFSLR